jgi:hypothetical protein
VRGAEDGVDERGFAVVDVGDDGEVSDFIDRGHKVSKHSEQDNSPRMATDCHVSLDLNYAKL